MPPSKYLCILVATVIAVAGCFRPQQPHRATMDRALEEWSLHPTTRTIRALVQVRP